MASSSSLSSIPPWSMLGPSFDFGWYATIPRRPPSIAPATPQTCPFFFVSWSPPRDMDGDPILDWDVHQLIVPLHLVTPDRRTLLAKKLLTTTEVKLIESWVKVEWKAYRVKYGDRAVSIRHNAKDVCPCEDSKACPGNRSQIQYCKECIKEDPKNKHPYMETKGMTKEERKAIEELCGRHVRCWCKDQTTRYSNPAEDATPCLFCKYIPPPPKPKVTKKKGTTTKRPRVASGVPKSSLELRLDEICPAPPEPKA